MKLEIVFALFAFVINLQFDLYFNEDIDTNKKLRVLNETKL